MTTVRAARSDDLAGTPSVAALAQGASGPVRVAIAGGMVVAAAHLDPSGGPTEPGTPRITLELVAGTVEGHRTAVAALLESVVADARSLGARRVVLPWSAMDASAHRTLAGSGFRPTGTWPYFDLGGGAIEHVTGYRDPVGSVVDLGRDVSDDRT